MPIFEIRYRTWEGDINPALLRFLSIPKFTLLSNWNKFLTMAMFATGAQLFAYGSFLMIVTNPLVQEFLNISADRLPDLGYREIFRNFYNVQFFIVLLVCLVMAPNMISSERAHKAMALMYSRPLTRWQYICGKFLAIALPVSAITWVAGTILFILMLSFYPIDSEFFTSFWSQSLPVWLLSCLIGLLLTISMPLFFLACSASTMNKTFAGAIAIVILFATSLITSYVQEEVYASFPDISLRNMTFSLGQLWLDPDPPSEISPIALAISFPVWIGTSLWFMLWRLRPMDIYRD